MNFCPRCGTPLVSQMEGGRERPACPAPDCRYFHFGDYSIGCGGVVIRDGKGLLIQRGINPNRGAWQLPGGYVEADEDIVEAVQREVLEEAGVEAKVQDIVGFRHSIAGSIGGPSANIYVVFRLTPISGEPRFDGDETIGAGYFSLDEIAEMDRVQGLSVWAIRRALELPLTQGFGIDRSDDSLTRPGWMLFAPKS